MPKLRRGRSGHKMVVTNGKLMVGQKNLDDGDIGCGNHDGGVYIIIIIYI